MLRTTLCILVVLVGLAEARADRQEPGTVLVLGDSLSAAYNISLDEGWVALMQARANQHSCNVTVVNASISGETTAGGLVRLPRLLEQNRPALVVIELGGNDALRGLSLKSFRANLAEIIRLSRAAGASVVLSEMRIPSNYGKRYSEKFRAIYHELAERDDVHLLPFLLHNVALVDGLMQADGIHPAAVAQPLILDNVWTVVEPLLTCCATGVQ
nr:esterase TesA-like [Nerophis lumbriciformis]